MICWAILEKWQTLISGGFATTAALIGALYLYLQIRQQRDFEQDRLKRRQNAARSTMPLVLSSIIQYATEVGRELRRLYEETPGDTVQRDLLISLSIPSIPQNDTVALADVIEAAPNDIADNVADLLGRLQVQASRIRGLRAGAVAGIAGQRNIPKPQFAIYIKDIADVYARCNLLFDYARRKSDVVPQAPNPDDIRQALFLMGYHGDALAELIQHDL